MKSERISPFWVGGYHPFSAAVNALVGLINEWLVEPVIIEPYVDDVLRATHGAHTAAEAIFYI